MVSPSGIVTLLTDFGTRDPFVGCMKGVIYERFPGAKIVDLTHEIPAQDVAAGSFWLARSHRYFPRGTVHLAVVDPGVGTSRRPIAALAGGHVFVGPDNGLFSDVLRGIESASARVLDPARHARRENDEIALSKTFHGRDLFAPVAAAIASGSLAWESVGEPAGPIEIAPEAPVLVDETGAHGEVVAVDRFGNLLTNLDARLVAKLAPKTVTIAGRALPVCTTYGDADLGAMLALVNSFDVLEIAKRGGDAAAELGATRGTKVDLVAG